jgi:uracil-DNA glycosylase
MLLQTVNIQEVQEKLYQKLEGTNWNLKLRTFLNSQDMTSILDTLLKEAMDNKRFTPVVKDVFNAFIECPYEKTRVVIIGQDPYPQYGVADGIAFSCSKKGKVEKSLELIHGSIRDTVSPDYQGPVDLRAWASQGVLLLNSAFTTTINKPGSHYLLWRPFLVQVIDSLIWEKQGLIYVFMGKKAQDYADLIPDNNHKIFVSHPASVAYYGSDTWDCNDLWNTINKYLKQNNDTEISW